jgi:hypothetical protein
MQRSEIAVIISDMLRKSDFESLSPRQRAEEQASDGD